LRDSKIFTDWWAQYLKDHTELHAKVTYQMAEQLVLSFVTTVLHTVLEETEAKSKPISCDEHIDFTNHDSCEGCHDNE
jgi:hypothetical protein